MSLKSSGYDILRITIYEYCGTLLMDFKCGSSIPFLTTYFFMISVLCFNFVRWREAWQATCPPFHIPLLCILDNPTIARVRTPRGPKWCNGERIGLVTQISVGGVRFPSSPTFYPENPVYVQITWWHIIYWNNKVDAVPTTTYKLNPRPCSISCHLCQWRRVGRPPWRSAPDCRRP